MKFYIHTLGCKVNQYESDSIAACLAGKGHTAVNSLDEADVCIVNTCAVTNEAEKKSRQAVSKMKQSEKKPKVYVCGCASQNNEKQFAEIDGVSYITGVGKRLSLVEKILSEFGEGEFPAVRKESRTRVLIKIQDGCNRFCTYCIVPHLRGRSTSRNMQEIIREVEAVPECKEIVVTGVDISDYRIEGKLALPSLLTQLSSFGKRIRLSSLEQSIVSDEFCEVLKTNPQICPHIHLSLQSGSNAVLKKMNRRYTAKEYLRAVKKLRKINPKTAITTDIIVGFPGETLRDFRQTVRLVKKAKFSRIHAFPYSPKLGTPAAEMPEQIPKEEKKKRLHKILRLALILERKYLKRHKKNLLQVLIEEKIGDYYVGYSEYYIRCYIDNDDELELNTFVNVSIREKFYDGVICDVEKELEEMEIG